MTVALVAVGGVAAALGTRLCALAFIASAVLAARNPAPVLAAIGTWTCALLAGWALLGPHAPTRIAVPAFGAAAVLSAAAAPNVAVVLGLWALGTVAAFVTRAPSIRGRRWAALLCTSDVLIAAALASTASDGFQGWPFTLRLPGVCLLLAAAVVRAPLAAGSDDETSMPALVVVRLQAVLLVAYAVASSTPNMLRAVVVAAAIGFLLAAAARRPDVVDVSQELALAAMALATTRLGWQPSGWLWGALAAGTLMHQLRFSLADARAAAYVEALRRAAGLGLAFLPVVVAQLEASFRSGDWTSAVVLLGVAGGLAGRSRIVLTDVPPARTRGVAQATFAWLPLAAATTAAMWAPLLALPRPPAGQAVAWPDPWALAIVVTAVIVGLRASPMAEALPREAVRSVRMPDRLRAAIGVVDGVATDRAIWTGFALVVATAIALWTMGLVRGFL